MCISNSPTGEPCSATDQARAASSAPLLQHDSSASSRFRHCSHDGTIARADGSVGGSSRDRSAPVSQSMHPPAFLRVTSGASIAASYYRPTPKRPTIAVRYAPRRLPDTVNAVTRKVEVVQMLASETVPSVEDAETPWCYRYPAGYCYARFHRTTIHCDVLPTHMTDTSPLRPTMTYGEQPIRGPHPSLRGFGHPTEHPYRATETAFQTLMIRLQQPLRPAPSRTHYMISYSSSRIPAWRDDSYLHCHLTRATANAPFHYQDPPTPLHGTSADHRPLISRTARRVEPRPKIPASLPKRNALEGPSHDSLA